MLVHVPTDCASELRLLYLFFVAFLFGIFLDDFGQLFKLFLLFIRLLLLTAFLKRNLEEFSREKVLIVNCSQVIILSSQVGSEARWNTGGLVFNLYLQAGLPRLESYLTILL